MNIKEVNPSEQIEQEVEKQVEISAKELSELNNMIDEPVFEDELEVPEIEFTVDVEDNDENLQEEEKKVPLYPKKDKVVSDTQKILEELFVEFEKLKNESKEKQMRAKEIKEEIINVMNDKGYDEVIINGLDSVVMLSITFPEREFLNKKALSEALNIKQKELSKPEVIIGLTKEGKITTDMIALYTEIEERMQFSSQDYNPQDE